MFEMGKIIGKKIVAIRAFQSDKRKKTGLMPTYILFDDEETVLELDEQDYYCYHDCSPAARHIRIHIDKRLRKIIFDNIDGVYPDANFDSY